MSIEADAAELAHHGPMGARPKPIAWLERINDIVGHLVEFPAAMLVLAEVGVLLMGVIWRYALHRPLIWSDELASILFLWLAMLGSVVALRRGEHMRMTALVNGRSPQTRALLETFAIAASVAFLALVLAPAFDYAAEERFIVTPALEISNGWRAAAIPLGMGLMLVTALLRLPRVATPGRIVVALAGTAAIVLAFWLLAPLFGLLFGRRLAQGGSRVPFVAGFFVPMFALVVLLAGTWMFLQMFQGQELRTNARYFAFAAPALGLLGLFAWPRAFGICLVYAVLARLPVVGVQFLDVQNGWQTHFRKLPAQLPALTGSELQQWLATVEGVFWLPCTVLLAGGFAAIGAKTVRAG